MRLALKATLFVAVHIGAGDLVAQATGPSTGGAAATAAAARMLGHTKRVLMVAAHPDDEDTELLTYLVRHEGALAAYLSLTRGEGGQNLIGSELGEGLGLIRTEELLAARSLDGARQYFTRAFDFGFSKSLEETSRFWPRDSILKDAVRIVRRFQPQVVVSIFSGTPRDGHGQHQMAGWVAREAFKVAGDPTRFPELQTEEGLAPHTPLKLFRSARFDTTGGSKVVLEGGLLDPEVGQSYRQIAMRGRSLHRSQDMGALQEVGPSPIRLVLLEDRTTAGSVAGGLFAGLDTSLAVAGAASADLEPYRAIAEAGRDGVIVDAITNESRLVAGQTAEVRLSAWNAGRTPVTVRPSLTAPEEFQVRSDCLDREVGVAAGSVHHCLVLVVVPEHAEPTVPYFLTRPRAGSGAWYHWTGRPAVFGLPFDPPILNATFSATVDGRRYTLEREVVERVRDQTLGELRRPLAVVPRVSVKMTPSIKVWPVRSVAPQVVTVLLQHAGRDSTWGTVSLDLPPRWPAVPAQPFRLTRNGERRSVDFRVRPPAALAPGDYLIRSVVKDQVGRRYEVGQVAVSYPHIRERGYVVSAATRVRAAAVTLPTRRRIGYVRGAADQVPEALAGVGLDVELLDEAALERSPLNRFDAIIVGSRAYESNPALKENNGRLLDYVRQGGHLVVQYQQHGFFNGPFAPYAMTVAPQHDRVTDETAPMQPVRDDLPVLRTPHRIGSADFEGWVQERGLYFARTWDPRYRPVFRTTDAGGPPLEGGLLTASYGRGTYVYTGLAFFRQLPAGVPGAFRLFLNLIDLPPSPRVP